MTFSHPFSRYGLALVMLKEEVNEILDITPTMLRKHLEDGLSHFRLQSNNNPEIDDELLYSYFPMHTIINSRVKGDPKKGIYLCPNIITTDKAAKNAWGASYKLVEDLSDSPSLSRNIDVTMSLVPIANKLNNGSKGKSYSKFSLLEVACGAITNTTHIKPYFAYKKKGDKGQLNYIPTAIIPDIELSEMKTFIQFYNLMIDTTINQKKLLKKKIYRKEGEKAKFSRPPIYNGNFPYAPQNSAFGVVSLLGAIGRWAKEAGYSDKGQKVLESLKDKPLYIVQYGNAQSVMLNHYIIDLANENKLSEIVSAIQKSTIIHPFDETKQDHKKGIESRKERFNLFSSRFLQLFNKPAFKDFISVRAEYSDKLIELFNTFFLKQMKISKEVVQSVRALGLWLNYVAYKVGKQEADNQKKPDKALDYKAKTLIELESSVFGARKPAEVLNVIVRAGRLSGMDAPAEADIFQEAVLTEEITIDDAKSMLMAYARTRNRYESNDSNDTSPENIETEEFEDADVTE